MSLQKKYVSHLAIPVQSIVYLKNNFGAKINFRYYNQKNIVRLHFIYHVYCLCPMIICTCLFIGKWKDWNTDILQRWGRFSICRKPCKSRRNETLQNFTAQVKYFLGIPKLITHGIYSRFICFHSFPCISIFQVWWFKAIKVMLWERRGNQYVYYYQLRVSKYRKGMQWDYYGGKCKCNHRIFYSSFLGTANFIYVL